MTYPSPEEFSQAITTALDSAIKAVTSHERIMVAITNVTATLESIQRLAEDGDLEPELLTAIQHLGYSGDALTRAAQFVMARFDVATQQAYEQMGGTPE